jgi:hypothetical protein
MQMESDPDGAWVAGLAGCAVDQAAALLREGERDRRLFGQISREHAKEGRPSYVEIDAPRELSALVRLTRPRHVVEVGVSSGVSSAYILDALDRNGSGTLHSVDLPSFPRPSAKGKVASSGSWTLPAGRSTGWAIPFALRKRWDLRLGDKRDVLPLLAEELPEIDLFLYDVPHEDRSTFREFLSLDARVPSGAIAIADHGPSGDLCTALRRWARKRGGTPLRRSGLGLYGFRCA